MRRVGSSGSALVVAVRMYETAPDRAARTPSMYRSGDRPPATSGTEISGSSLGHSTSTDLRPSHRSQRSHGLKGTSRRDHRRHRTGPSPGTRQRSAAREAAWRTNGCAGARDTARIDGERGDRAPQTRRYRGGNRGDRSLASGSSGNLDRVMRVLGPGSDRGVGSEAGLRFGVGVSPAHVGGDRSVLFGVTAVIGAAQCEVPQCRELGFDPVQPRPVRRQKHQLDVVVRRPRPHSRVPVRREVVEHHVQLLPGPPSLQHLEKARNSRERLRGRMR